MRSIITIAAVTILSLGTWVFFQQQDMRLTPPETVVVVGAWVAIVLLAKWLWVRIRDRKAKKDGVAKTASVLVVAFLGFHIAHARCEEGPLLAALSHERGDHAAAESEAAFPVACAPEKPAIYKDESVVLRAWASAPQAQTLRYTWTAKAGTISGQGNEVRWDLKGIPAGIYKVDLKVEEGTSAGGSCSLRVAVIEPERGAQAPVGVVARESARTILLKGQQETAGYGLYSYLLLGSSPTDSTRPRDLAVLQAYLRRILDVAKLEDYVAHARLNITYLPLETAAPGSADAAWYLDHYDYARARVLLDFLPGNRRDGIYVVSSLKPLSGGPNPPYLLQDFSTLPTEPPDLISWWMREFLNQAAQEQFWEPKTGERFVLNLRTTISVLAIGLPEVQKAVTGWVTWIH